MPPQGLPCPLKDPNLRPTENATLIPAPARFSPSTLFLRSPYPPPGTSHAPICLANTHLHQSAAQRPHASCAFQPCWAFRGVTPGHTWRLQVHFLLLTRGLTEDRSSLPRANIPPVPHPQMSQESEVYLGIMKYRTQTSHCAWYKALLGRGAPREGSESKEGRSASHPLICTPVPGTIHLDP